MQGAFLTVVVIVGVVGVVGALAGLVLNGRTWEEYGRGHLLLESDAPRARTRAVSGPAAVAERDEEVRQMLEARNARRRRRGESELDIESELARLTGDAPAVDDELREEIRELVVARNHRRARRGEPALDVESEIERQIAELGRL